MEERMPDDLDPRFDGAVIEPLGVDGNGCPTERMWLGDTEVVVRLDDVPESDLTVVKGIPCTTALRTAIDIAPDVSIPQLRDIVADCLARGLFTLDEAHHRLAQPDMAHRRGAGVVIHFRRRG
jgi:hypothetical protein